MNELKSKSSSSNGKNNTKILQDKLGKKQFKLVKDYLCSSLLYNKDGLINFTAKNAVEDMTGLNINEIDTLLREYISPKKLKLDVNKLEKNKGIICCAEHIRTYSEELFVGAKMESCVHLSMLDGTLDKEISITQDTLKRMINNVKISDSSDSYVEGNILYVPKDDECLKMSKSDFYKRVLDCTIWNNDVVPTELSKKLAKILLGANALVLLPDDMFVQLYNYCSMVGMTMKDFVTSLGFAYIPYSEVISEFGYFYIPLGEDNILVDFIEKTEIIPIKVFTSLYELSILETAHLEDSVVYLTYEGNDLPIEEFYDVLAG